MRTPHPWVPPEVPTRSRDLRALGISSRKLASELDRGTIIRLRRGVFVATDSVPKEDARSLHLLRALAEQAVVPQLVASGETAALAWGLPLWHEASVADGPVHLVLPRGHQTGVRSATTATARIRVATLPEQQIVTGERGLRLTSRTRTAVDLAPPDLPGALVVLDAAMRAECQLIPSVRRREDLADPRVRDAARGRLVDAAAVDRRLTNRLTSILPLADPRRETPIESLSAGHMMLADLPAAVPQAPIQTLRGIVYPDFLWPELRVIGEADGALKYSTPEVMLAEKEREQVLRDLGFAIVRWTGREILTRPDRVIERIARALDAPPLR